ncbi:hypothetical protein, partial [Aeromonas caviae]|uniref:hypothetical protein n=1 Tax=Aeromonas caviae TaxID=648 RepID=UPI001CC370E9
QAEVLAELHAAGFTMTMASFKSALQRIRKERAGDRPAAFRHDEVGPEQGPPIYAPACPLPVPCGCVAGRF